MKIIFFPAGHQCLYGSQCTREADQAHRCDTCGLGHYSICKSKLDDFDENDCPYCARCPVAEEVVSVIGLDTARNRFMCIQEDQATTQANIRDMTCVTDSTSSSPVSSSTNNLNLPTSRYVDDSIDSILSELASSPSFEFSAETALFPTNEIVLPAGATPTDKSEESPPESGVEEVLNKIGSRIEIYGDVNKNPSREETIVKGKNGEE